MPSLTKIVTSPGWKKLMARMYGWGAAIVIVGALFKILHWPYANQMLIVGMGTEAIIFFFSAFEILPSEFHWDFVFPELKGGHSNGRAMAAGRGGAELAIDPNDAERLKKSVERFNQSVNSLNALSTIGDASNQFVSGLQQAAGNINVLNQTAQTFAAAYNQTSQTVATSGQQANANLAALNKNLQAVNTSYELYLQEHQGYVTHSKQLLSTMDHSAKQSLQLDQQLAELTKLVVALNTAYTSVVNTVNSTLKKR